MIRDKAVETLQIEAAGNVTLHPDSAAQFVECLK